MIKKIPYAHVLFLFVLGLVGLLTEWFLGVRNTVEVISTLGITLAFATGAVGGDILVNRYKRPGTAILLMLVLVGLAFAVVTPFARPCHLPNTQHPAYCQAHWF